MNEQITAWVDDLTSLNEARDVIRGNLDEIGRLRKVSWMNASGHPVTVDFGYVDFPTNCMKLFIPAGSMKRFLLPSRMPGAKWWCVLFPRYVSWTFQTERQ